MPFIFFSQCRGEARRKPLPACRRVSPPLSSSHSRGAGMGVGGRLSLEVGALCNDLS